MPIKCWFHQLAFSMALIFVFPVGAVENNCNIDLINFGASVRVKNVSELSLLNQTAITIRAIMDRSSLASIYPIYAYDSRLLCRGGDSFWKDNKGEITIKSSHHGPYTLVVEESPDSFVAFYFEQLDSAIQVAKKCESLCGTDPQWPSSRWFLGSTYPIPELTRYKREGFVYGL